MYYGTLADPKGDGDILQEISYAKDAGFDFLEISAEGPRFTTSKLLSRVSEIKKARDDAGIFFTCHTPWGWNVGNPYKPIRDATLSEVSRDLRVYLDGIEFNPRRLEQVETRLELLHQLKRKYGSSIEAVIAYGRSAREQLEKVQHAGERIEELQAEEIKAVERVSRAGEILSQKRRQAALQLSADVEDELNDPRS